MSGRYLHAFPPELVHHVTSICGARGKAWFEQLPRLIAELEEKWELKVDAPFEKGEFNFVAPARSRDGSEFVLKIAPPYKDTEIFAEAAFLSARDGNGCVKLIEVDRTRHAILMERVRPGVNFDVHFADDPERCIEPAIKVLRKIAMPAAVGDEVQSLDEWFDRFSRSRDTDFPHAYGERALSIYDRLRIEDDRTMYLHGDFHPGNIVTSHDQDFLVIDPKGVAGHLSYDIAVFLNNLYWWKKAEPGVDELLNTAVKEFAAAFAFQDRDLREAAFTFAVIGAWWNFDEMPEHYDNEVALADIWDI